MKLTVRVVCVVGAWYNPGMTLTEGIAVYLAIGAMSAFGYALRVLVIDRRRANPKPVDARLFLLRIAQIVLLWPLVIMGGSD